MTDSHRAQMIKELVTHLKSLGITSLKEWRLTDPDSYNKARYRDLVAEVETKAGLARYRKVDRGPICEEEVRDWLSTYKPKNTAVWNAVKKSYMNWARANGLLDILCQEYSVTRIGSGRYVSPKRCKYMASYLRRVILENHIISGGELKRFNYGLYQRTLTRPELRNVCEELGIRFRTFRRKTDEKIETGSLSSINFGLTN